MNYSICELYLNKSIILKFVNEVLNPQNPRKRGIEKPKKQIRELNSISNDLINKDQQGIKHINLDI